MPPAAAHVVPPPPAWTTADEFLARRCNRCGDCCAGFWLPSIFDLTDALMWAFHDCARGSLGKAVRELGYMRQQQRYNPGNVEAVFKLLPCYPDEREHHDKMRRQAEWLLDLEPIAEPQADHELYRCTRLVHDPDGLAVCTAYERRPPACALYPYAPGEPDNPYRGPALPNYPRCSWYARIIPIRYPPPAETTASFVDEALPPSEAPC